jgi:hypothetical protein
MMRMTVRPWKGCFCRPWVEQHEGLVAEGEPAEGGEKTEAGRWHGYARQCRDIVAAAQGLCSYAEADLQTARSQVAGQPCETEAPPDVAAQVHDKAFTPFGLKRRHCAVQFPHEAEPEVAREVKDAEQANTGSKLLVGHGQRLHHRRPLLGAFAGGHNHLYRSDIPTRAHLQSMSLADAELRRFGVD